MSAVWDLFAVLGVAALVIGLALAVFSWIGRRQARRWELQRLLIVQAARARMDATTKATAEQMRAATSGWSSPRHPR